MNAELKESLDRLKSSKNCGCGNGSETSAIKDQLTDLIKDAKTKLTNDSKVTNSEAEHHHYHCDKCRGEESGPPPKTDKNASKKVTAAVMPAKTAEKVSKKVVDLAKPDKRKK